MAHITKPRVLETSTTAGTGAFTLLGAVSGFQAFNAVMSSPSDTCFYYIEDVDANGNPNGSWEEGFGTYSAADTLTRTTLLNSSTGSAISFGVGTKRVSLTFPAFRAAGADVQVFTATGANTWTNPSPLIAKKVDIYLLGGGGGGASGSKLGSGSSIGGGGGGGGARATATMLSTLLGSTETANIGVGGVGGVPQTVNGSSGIAPVAAGATWFGTSSAVNHLIAAAGGPGGNTGTAGVSRTGFPVNSNVGPYGSTAGGTGNVATGGTGSASGPGQASPTGGGGGGGGNTGGNTTGGAGGQQTTTGATASGEVATTILGGSGNSGAAGTAGTARSVGDFRGGLGGGGGGYNSGSATAFAGGGGGYPAGGGGGGAGGVTGVADSGAGGNGAAGIALIITHL